MIVRGTTPLQRIDTDHIDLTDAKIVVSYSQEGRLVFEKSGRDIEVFEDCIMIQLTQKDTLSLTPHAKVKIQFRYVFPDGSSDASNVMMEQVGDILQEGELHYASQFADYDDPRQKTGPGRRVFDCETRRRPEIRPPYEYAVR